jgi:transcriptional regulator GlxA family with amidase domain
VTIDLLPAPPRTGQSAYGTFLGYVWAMAGKSLRIHILALRDSTALVPIGLADMLRKATQLAETMPQRRPRPRLVPTLVAPGADLVVSGAGGVRVHCDLLLKRVRRAEVVLVPALDPDVVERLAANRDAAEWLRRMYRGGADVASCCTGAFLLGEAGLLDGRSATTHWAFQELLRARYPRVRLQPQAIVVDEGRVCTAGGATSFLNLALYLIERWLGSDVARAASRMFLVDVNKSPQSAYAMFASQKTHADAEILRAQALIEENLAQAPSVEQLSRQVAMSRRTFVRRFTRATGNSPRAYLQRIKTEAAKRALETSSQPISDIASEVGYADLVAFRRLFLRHTGLTPADYRRRYGPRSTPAVVVSGRRAEPGRTADAAGAAPTPRSLWSPRTSR